MSYMSAVHSWDSSVWVCRGLGIHSHIEDIRFGVIINEAVVNIHVQTFVGTYVFLCLGSPLSLDGHKSLMSSSCFCLFSPNVVRRKCSEFG